jgi:hypothetical protein
MRSDIHATRRIGQQGSLPTFAAPAQTVPKTTDFGTVLKVGSAGQSALSLEQFDGPLTPFQDDRRSEVHHRRCYTMKVFRQRTHGIGS